MTDLDIAVSRITSGEELKEARRSYRTPELSHPGWGESVESGRSAIFAAWIGEVVVAHAILSMVGPHPRDVQLNYVYKTVFPDEKKPTPVAYGFRTKRQFRNLGAAKAMGRAIQDWIVEVPEVMPRIMLSVGIDNAPALSVYNALDYKVLIANGQGVFRTEAPRYSSGKMEVYEKDVFYMAKDLSTPTGNP